MVTGGTGFVGSHVVEKLLLNGANIFITYRSLNPRSYFAVNEFNKKTTLVACDLKDKERVIDIVSKYEIDYIFHIAAQSLVTVAFINPYETLTSNIIGTINVLEAARNCGKLKGIIVFSSDKAYGVSNDLPYKETHPLQGKHPYDCSKSCEDLIAQMYYHSYSLPIAVIRSGNIFGPGDLNFNRIIPGALKSIIEDKTLDIRSDGKMIREYVFVKDAANACVLAANNIDKINGEAFNLGSKNIYSVLEVLERIEKILGKKVKTKILNIAKNEIPKQHLNYDKIKKAIGWNNEFDFDTAIKETYKWYEEQLR